MFARHVLLLSVITVSAGCAHAAREEGIGLPGIGAPGGERAAPRPPLYRSDRNGLAVLPNPSFEAIASWDPGFAADWNPEYTPLWSPRAFDGTRAVRLTGRNRYQVRLLPPEPAWTRSVFSHWHIGQTGGERTLALLISRLGQDDVYYGNRQYTSAEQWSPLYTPFASFPTSAPTAYYVQAADERSWVDTDAVALLRENFRDGGFDGPAAADARQGWMPRLGATVGGGLATLPPGSSLLQQVAAVPDGQQQFLALLPGPLSPTPVVNERLLSISGEEVTSRTLELSPTLGRGAAATWYIGSSRPIAGAPVASVEIASPGGGTVTLDKATRGSITVFPHVFQPVPGSSRSTLRFAASWIGESLSASVDVADSSANLVATISLEGDGHGASAEWDGGESPSGSYTAHFNLHAGSGELVSLSEAFTIDREATFPDSPPLHQDDMVLGAWIWILRDGTSVDALRPIFAQAQADGFDTALVFLRPDQHAAVRSICEELGFPFFATGNEFEVPIKSSPMVTDFDGSAYTSLLDSALGDLVGSPMYRGLYIADEPLLPFALPRAGAALRVMNSQGRWGRGIYSMVPAQATASNYATAEAGVHISDFYTFETTRPADADALAMLGQYSSSQNGLARDAGVRYWAIPQSCSIPDYLRPPSPAATRASIGTELAHGTRGLFPFVYRTIGGIEGIRDLDLDTTAKGEAWLSEIARIRTVGPLLAALEGHATVPSDGPVLCTNAVAGDATHYTFVVNQDTDATATIGLALSGATTVLDAITGQTLATTTDTLALEAPPGVWRLLDLNDVTVEHASALAGSAPPRPLPVPTLATLSGSAGPVTAIDISQDGTRLAFTQSDGTRVVDTLSTPTLETTIPLVRGASATFTSPTLLLSCDVSWGLYETDLEGLPLTHDVARGTTGNADSAVEVDGTVLVSTDYLGIRILHRDEGGTLQEAGRIPLDDDIFQILATPVHGVFLVIADYGIFRVDLAESPLAAEAQASGSRFWRAALSPDGKRLAVAQLERGIALYQLDEQMRLLEGTRYPRITADATSIAWLDDNNLLVTDGIGGVRLFGMRGDVPVADPRVWNPFADAAFLQALVVRAGLVAVGDTRGRVAIARAADVPRAFQGAGWMLQ